MKLNLHEANAISNFPFLNLDAYLLHCLNNFPNDRDFIVRVELNIIRKLLKNGEMDITFFGLNSYLRMLVHRIARYYMLERLADGVQRTVTIYRPSSTYIRPLIKLSGFVEPNDNIPPEEQSSSSMPVSAVQRKITIMKRSTSVETGPKDSIIMPAKTLEEREKEYEAARARIFQNDEDLTINDDPAILPSVGLESFVTTETDSDEVVHFRGWKDIDSIKPFIPDNIPSDISHGNDTEEFDFATVWIPQHMFVAIKLPNDESALKMIKLRCKQHHCKLYAETSYQAGLVLFNYKVGETEEQISDMLGLSCYRWRPFYLPEPPI